MTRFSLLLVLLALGALACDGPTEPVTPDASTRDAGTMMQGDGGRVRTGSPGATMTACPPGGTTLTWDDFGSDLLEAYCTRCHASGLTGGDRNGAPTGLDWDVLETVRENADRIDRVAGAGATRINTFMPLGDPDPTDAEREQLAEWLACGAP